MSRVIRFELSLKNVVVLGFSLLFLVAAATWFTRFLGARLAGAGSEARHSPGEADEHGGHEERAEHAGREEGKVELSGAALANAGLELATAGPGEVNVILTLPGEVSLNQDTLAHVTPRVSGTAREVRRNIGELVKKGEVLAILESRDLAEAQRDFAASKERQRLAEATFARAELLQRENVSADKDFLAAKQALAEAQIEHKSAAQKLQAVGGPGAGGNGYALVAPFPGTIIEKHISVGEVLSEESRAFTIADLSSVWVNVTVYAKDLSRVKVGQRAEVRAEGIAEPATGTIAYLGQVVGEVTRSATARIVLERPGAAWRPGLFATAAVSIEQLRAAVVVDDAALQTVEGRDVIFVGEGEAFRARTVSIGRRGEAPAPARSRVLEVRSGLLAGERYVIKNSFLLKAELGKAEAGHDH